MRPLYPRVDDGYPDSRQDSGPYVLLQLGLGNVSRSSARLLVLSSVLTPYRPDTGTTLALQPLEPPMCIIGGQCQTQQWY